jgi:hypothetical protein
VTGVDWLCLALLLGMLAALIAWQLDVGAWISHRIRARREAERLPDYYEEQDWT